MANITMSDYIGFIFSEVTRARVIADSESRRIAELYATDEVLKNFSVPRFKIPEMNLSIPVIVSGAKFSTVLAFSVKKDDFIAFLQTKMKNALTTLRIKMRRISTLPGKIDIDLVRPRPNIIAQPIRSAVKGRGSKKDPASDEKMLNEFYILLKENSDPSDPDNIVHIKWSEYFFAAIESHKLLDYYKKHYPNNELYIQTLNEVLEWVKHYTIVVSTRIDNLLVDPETNTVKNNSTDSTIFLINAKIMEEGIFIKSVKNTETGEENKIVEFE